VPTKYSFLWDFKSPINSGNINTIKAVFDQIIEYLKKLKINEIPIVSSGRKMFVIGFIIIMKSTLCVSYQLLNKSQSPLKFVLTYKMSQGHLEFFFGCVRARGGSNNNPNSVQFKNTLRQLLFTKNITVESGNCSNLYFPEGDIIEFRSEKRSLIEPANTVNESELEIYLSVGQY